jgi:hypothetical protein
MSRSKGERPGPSIRTVLGLVVAMALAIALSAMITLWHSPAGGSTVPAMPRSTVSRLTSFALRLARSSGDPRPDSVLVVRTTHARALRVATPGDTVPGNGSKLVYLVVMRGDFTANFASPPSGGRLPTGTYLDFTIDPATFKVLDLGLNHHAPVIQLSNFGPVTRLV